MATLNDVKASIKAWDGHRHGADMDDGTVVEWVTDGSMALKLDALKPAKLKLLAAHPDPDYRYVPTDKINRLINKEVDRSRKARKLTTSGSLVPARYDNRMFARYTDGAGLSVWLDADKVALIAAYTGADPVEVREHANNTAVIFCAGDDPVAVLMPVTPPEGDPNA